MIINKLLIDAGNSAIKWSFIEGHDLSLPLLMQTSFYPSTDLIIYFKSLWETQSKPECVIISCVASETVFNALNDACKALWAVEIDRVKATKEFNGLFNTYAEVTQLGADRWCAMVAAYHQYNKNIIIVDCGTAITIDVINSNGEFIGGYILPGLFVMKSSLLNETASITIAEDEFTESTSLETGNSTLACIDSGILLSVVSLIESAFHKYMVNESDAKCVMTGGNAKRVSCQLSIKHEIVEDLVLQGLCLLAQKPNQL